MQMLSTNAIHHVRIAIVVAILGAPRQGLSAEVAAFAEPYRDIDVAASEMGTLSRIEVKEGDLVAAGQVLGGLDEDVLQASLNMTRAALKSRGRINGVLAELRLQTDRLEKLISLRERQHASQEEVERTKAQKEISEANLEALRDELRIKSFEHERIEAELRRRRLISPIDGVVTVVYKDVGEFVSATDPMVVKVVQLDPLLVIFSVPVAAADQLAESTTLPVTVGDDPNPVTGFVEFVSPTADAQSNTVRVKIRLPNPGFRLQCGAACRLDLPDSSAEATGTSQAARRPPGSSHTREVVHRQRP